MNRRRQIRHGRTWPKLGLTTIGGIALPAVLWIGVLVFGSQLIGCSTETASVSGQSGAQEELKYNPQVVIPKPFPAIVQPKSVSAEEADKTVHPEELVLGVEVNGKARAYPINMLTGPQREIINDQLGGQAIAATW